MTRRRFDNLDPERQKRLFEIAAEEFGERGYDAASLNRIIARSGMGKSSFYYYFDDKADLFNTLLERAFADLFKEVGGIDLASLTAETFWKNIEDLCRQAAEVMGRDVAFVRLGRMFYRLRNDPKETSSTNRLFEEGRLWIGAALARGQELGIVRTDLPASLLVDCTMGLLEALDRWSVAHWEEMDGTARPRMVSAQIGLLRRVLA
ncbi:MAG TPA: TetR/AcrR family transcriptional regulator [Rhizobiaceae bacterium]|nr:TetR/AcrR family transcriptional regulator [Rhizobiaceae bacterium]